MATLLTFPMRNDLPNYSFDILLSGTTFNCLVVYNSRMNRWILNINDQSGNPILNGIPVLIERDLTGQYGTLSLPDGVFFATDDTGMDTQPTRFSFGVDHTLFYVDEST